MKSEEQMYDLADLFKLFSDSTRIRILYTLSEKEACVGGIAAALSMQQTAISHQLRILKQGRLVQCRREGKQVFYALADGHVRSILDAGFEHISE